MDFRNSYKRLFYFHCIANIAPVIGFFLQQVLNNEVHHLCAQIKEIDCQTMYVTQDYEVTCGNDDVTYSNFCFYAQSKCRNATLAIKYIGNCDWYTGSADIISHTAAQSDVTTPVPVTTTESLFVKVFCVQADSYTCPNTLNPVCGSDGTFYLNDCRFAKAVCEDRALSKQELDICKHPPTHSHAASTSKTTDGSFTLN